MGHMIVMTEQALSYGIKLGWHKFPPLCPVPPLSAIWGHDPAILVSHAVNTHLIPHNFGITLSDFLYVFLSLHAEKNINCLFAYNLITCFFFSCPHHHESWWGQLPNEPRIRPLSWHGIFLSCQESEELSTSFFWWRPVTRGRNVKF